jgi:hypothetical protein
MSSFFSLLLAIVLGLFLFWSTGTVSETATPVTLTPHMVGETLIIKGEDIVRLAHTTPHADDAYVASENSLFRTDDHGNWVRAGGVPPAGEIVFDAQNPDVLMVGDEEACARGGGGEILQTSLDGGMSWVMDPDGPRVRPLAIASEAGLVGGASCEGFVISTDMGETWSVVADDLLGFQVTAFSVIEGEQHVVLVGLTGEGGTGRLYRIDLSEPASPEVSEPLREYWGLGAVAGAGDTYYLATVAGLAVSKDAGLTWAVERTGLEDVTLAEDPVTEGLPVDYEQDTYGLYAIQLQDGVPMLLGAQTGVFESSDGRSWKPLAVPGTPFTGFEPLPIGDGVLAKGEDFVWVVYPAAERD